MTVRSEALPGEPARPATAELQGRPCASCGRVRAECRTPDEPFLSCCDACRANDGDTHSAPQGEVCTGPCDHDKHERRGPTWYGWYEPTTTAAPRDAYSPLHPHEPEVPPTLDDEGRCLTCRALLAAEELGWRRGQAVQTWLLTGDLDSLEFAISDYIWQYGQHLPGVVQETPAGVPTAVANMAMTVIRKNVRRVAGPNG